MAKKFASFLIPHPVKTVRQHGFRHTGVLKPIWRQVSSTLSKPGAREDTTFVERYPDAAERFEVAIAEGAQAQGVSVERQIQLHQRLSYAGCLGGLVGLGVVWWTAAVAAAPDGVIAGLFMSPAFAAVVATPVLAVMTLRGAFRNWQVRRRCLAPLHVWARSPREWFPEWN